MALMAACVPVITTLPEPLPATPAPPEAVTFRTPLETASCSELRLVCASPTEIPAIAWVVSSGIDCAPGTVLTGGVFAATAATDTENSEVFPVGSVAVIETHSPRATAALIGTLLKRAVPEALVRTVVLPR